MKPFLQGDDDEDDLDAEFGRAVLSKEDVELIFENAFRRNLAAVITSTLVDEDRAESDGDENALMAGSLRGDWRKGLLFQLLSKTTVYQLLTRLSQVQKNRFQGNASYHDLALAQCILEIHLHAVAKNKGSRIRKSSVATSAMALGRVVDALRQLHRAMLNDPHCELLPSLWQEPDIARRFPALYQRVVRQLDDARNVASKSKLLEKSRLSLSSLLGAFSILTKYGCDDFCADHFLWNKPS